jgi:hypothetical protein
MLIGAAGNMFDNVLEEEQFRQFNGLIIRLLDGATRPC